MTRAHLRAAYVHCVIYVSDMYMYIYIYIYGSEGAPQSRICALCVCGRESVCACVYAHTRVHISTSEPHMCIVCIVYVCVCERERVCVCVRVCVYAHTRVHTSTRTPRHGS